MKNTKSALPHVKPALHHAKAAKHLAQKTHLAQKPVRSVSLLAKKQ